MRAERNYLEVFCFRLLHATGPDTFQSRAVKSADVFRCTEL
jgi:hypothetical protein